MSFFFTFVHMHFIVFMEFFLFHISHPFQQKVCCYHKMSKFSVSSVAILLILPSMTDYTLTYVMSGLCLARMKFPTGMIRDSSSMSSYSGWIRCLDWPLSDICR